MRLKYSLSKLVEEGAAVLQSRPIHLNVSSSAPFYCFPGLALPCSTSPHVYLLSPDITASPKSRIAGIAAERYDRCNLVVVEVTDSVDNQDFSLSISGRPPTA